MPSPRAQSRGALGVPASCCASPFSRRALSAALPVALRLGQRVRAVHLDRVLRGHHEKRAGEAVYHAVCDRGSRVTGRRCGGLLHRPRAGVLRLDEYIVHLGRLGVVVRTVDRVPGTFPPQRLLVATRAGGPRPV
jgi:hypothetical protein